MSSQPWSNGKVGTIRVFFTAEWQLGVAAQGNPAFAAIIPRASARGGRAAPYFEQGWYRGRAVQMLFIAWLYGEQNQVSRQTRRRRVDPGFEDVELLALQMPLVDGRKGLDASARGGHHEERGRAGPHLRRLGRGFDRGCHDQRAPNDRTSRRPVQLHRYEDDVPGFWFMSWYDVSAGPNLAAYNFVRKTARPEYAVIAPTLHCSYKRGDGAYDGLLSAIWAMRGWITTR